MLSVGEILKKQRERLNIQYSDAEKAIKVRQKFLQAIENNDWSIFSSKIYISGIIKNYSTFLGLNPGNVLAFFRRDYAKKEAVRFKTKLAGHYVTPETKKIALLLLAAVFIMFFGYFGFQLKQYFSPPKLTIIEPRVDKFVKKNQIEIWGRTEKDAAVSIFGERIYQDKDGMFSYKLPLKQGKNELTIEVIGANGKKTTLKKIYLRTD